MKIYTGLFFLLLILLTRGCNKFQEEYYGTYPETVDQNFWEAMQEDPEISNFNQLLVNAKLDSLFQTDIAYSVFAPTNTALALYLDTAAADDLLLNYLISSHFIKPGSIHGKRKIQTLTEKFALFERNGSLTSFDGVELDFESPLYLNGKYFKMSEVAVPKLNLYQFIEVNHKALLSYIESKDSIIVDRENSKPIGFDEFGNTVYDTVATIYNSFEEKYFPVREEFREKTCTMVFPFETDYINALTEMARVLGPEFNDYNDIPVEWQDEVLIPVLLDHGMFLNMLEQDEFLPRAGEEFARMINIQGDTVDIDYLPVKQTICSNGYVYGYDHFSVPDSLYGGPSKFEGEELVFETGIGRFAWEEGVHVQTDISLEPDLRYYENASNDSLFRVFFPDSYPGSFILEFYTQSLFPGRYVMEVTTHMDIGGVYHIYVNDELVRTFDFAEYKDLFLPGIIASVTGEYFIPEGRFNKFDMYVDHYDGYAPIKIKFDYRGPGQLTENGLIIDCIKFMPVGN